MRADTLIALVRAMEAHPGVGLIQTLPIITGGSTLFARMQQFAGRVYGPVIAHGIAWWHGAEGNYWGHNALIRTIAFAEQAGLPELRGRKPFGGHIMSHDFIEAALMRRGGWAIHMMPGLEGSYEESPPTLMDLAVRDRRWCQGNLQHIAVLPARGLHWVSRMHLLTGIGSYITAPLWLLFLLCGILIALQARFIPPDYFPDAGKSLFPQWPVIDPVRAMWVFIGTMALLLVPKLLGMITVIAKPEARRGCGGVLRLAASLLLETLIAGLMAPVVMLTQTIDVGAILVGRDPGWNTQRRDDGQVPLRDIVRPVPRHTMPGGCCWAPEHGRFRLILRYGCCRSAGPGTGRPLAALTARRSLGVALRRFGLLRIPEEGQPPEVLRRVSALYRQATTEPPVDAISTLLHDPALLAAHRQMLPPPRRPGIDPLNVPLLTGSAKLAEADCLETAWPALNTAEKAAVLSDDRALERLATLRRADSKA